MDVQDRDLLPPLHLGGTVTDIDDEPGPEDSPDDPTEEDPEEPI